MRCVATSSNVFQTLTDTTVTFKAFQVSHFNQNNIHLTLKSLLFTFTV